MHFKPKRRPGIPKQIEISIHDLSDDGRGVGKYKGKTVFVRAALPGERVKVDVLKDNAKYADATLNSIIEPSAAEPPSSDVATSHRVTSACDYFPECGGCELHHLAIIEQRNHKQAVLLKMLQKFGGATPEVVLPPIVDADLGYRQRIRLSTYYQKGSQRVALGFRRKRDNQIVAIDQCVIMEPALAQLLPSLSELCNRMDGRRSLGHIELVGAGAVIALVLRVTERLSSVDLDQWHQLAEREGLNLYIQQGRGQEASARAELVFESGRQCYSLPAFNVTLDYHPQDFVQANRVINEQMVARAIDLLALKPSDHTLDLFCGLGNFSLPIASKGVRVTGIEVSSQMVKRAKVNAESNSLQDNSEFLAADLSSESWCDALDRNAYTKILLDPPRDGARQVVENIDRFESLESIVYVSCNPATLARDAGILEQKGYRLKQAGLLDMFPQTSHMEAIAQFERC